MLSEGLAYPRNDESWLKTTAIGGGLVLLGAFFFIPILPVYGYLLRALDAGARGERHPPRFDDWEGLFVDGIKLFAVMFILVGLPTFLLTVLIIFLGFGATAFIAGGGTPGTGAWIVAGFIGLLALLLLAILLVTGYVFPAALLLLARTDSIADAMDLGAFRQVAFDWGFFRAWLLVLGLGLTLGLVASLLTFLLVGVFITFYVQVVVFYILGMATGRAMDAPPAGSGGGHGRAGGHVTR